MIPNQRSFTYSIPVWVNSLGLRDDEVPTENTGKKRRILILGDSVTYGVLVAGDETYANQLEAMLNGEQSDLSYEVINAGVQRYYTYQELDYLRLRGLQLEPDIVILGYYINDLGIRPKTWHRDYEKSREKVMSQIWQKAPFLMHIFKNSALVSFVRDRYFRLRNAMKRKKNTQEKLLHGIRDVGIEKKIAVAREYITEFKQLGREHNFKFMIVAFPGVNQVINDSPNAIYPGFVQQISHELNVPFVDLLPYYKAHYDGDIRSLYFRYNGHPNRIGHRIAAETIKEKLSMLGWLSQKPPLK